MVETNRYIICDVDGVLADYVNGFYRWVAATAPELRVPVGRPYPSPAALRIREDEWRVLKHRYRTQGILLTLEPLDGAVQYLRTYAERGVNICLLTTRPGEDQYIVEEHTREWLAKHRIPFDVLEFTEDKVAHICEGYKPADVLRFIDDDPRSVLELAKLGYDCMWIGGRRLLGTPPVAGVHVFSSLKYAMVVQGSLADPALVDDAMWSRQKAFLESQMEKYPKDARQLHLAFCTHLAHEVHELMDTVPWKFTRRMMQASRKRLLEESVDVLKLWMNVLFLHDVGMGEFKEAFHSKSALVEQRAREEDEHAD